MQPKNRQSPEASRLCPLQLTELGRAELATHHDVLVPQLHTHRMFCTLAMGSLQAFWYKALVPKRSGPDLHLLPAKKSHKPRQANTPVDESDSEGICTLQHRIHCFSSISESSRAALLVFCEELCLSRPGPRFFFLAGAFSRIRRHRCNSPLRSVTRRCSRRSNGFFDIALFKVQRMKKKIND